MAHVNSYRVCFLFSSAMLFEIGSGIGYVCKTPYGWMEVGVEVISQISLSYKFYFN